MGNFSHIDNNMQGSLAGFIPITQSVDLSGRFIYQSRSFNKNGFSFFVPLVVGYPFPVITKDENIKSFGLMVGTKVSSRRNSLINTFFDSEVGLIYHSDSFYELNEKTIVKYSDKKILFEYSVGIGFNINLTSNYLLVMCGKLAHIPAESTFDFPINLGFQLLL
ncbi:MAG: hypothetical protein ACUVRG_09430 [Ignavibacterium sp.]|uniref:hypothetical protein n=1 Tax=Ignavibacterium sp. TaxID=2651167 RepID=UPI0040493E9C